MDVIIPVMVDKVFRHGKNLMDAIDAAEYTNNDPVSASPELSQVTVYNWENVKTTDKLNIEAKATLDGYSILE